MTYERLKFIFDTYFAGGLIEPEAQELMAYINNSADAELEAILKQNWENPDIIAVFTKDQSERILKRILNKPKPK
ncbi:hypothetical protein SAMN05216464_10874 [Mucilaginibacter pineti]|uniref:Uncharacterized protein n=1 Tax=Mucilaginibacter pineti TaxID=1391627 RepID=A0A1G7EKY6_9SPHI|nr:hypothetical protein [Mucilaginibacter pineti]SDE64363.1 hypothetical protein SAMN05216464_10874 [Mucilaginibacter pineti]